MRSSAPATLPGIPPSVAEWEDLLLRMEIMQRVLRNTLEAVPAGDAGAAEEVRALVERESEVGGWLEAVSGGIGSAVAGRAADAAAGHSESGDFGVLAEQFVSLRARNFAMLQRRGLEVWRWTAELSGHGEVSAFQVVSWLVANDVRSLAALRERSGTGTGAC